MIPFLNNYLFFKLLALELEWNEYFSLVRNQIQSQAARKGYECKHALELQKLDSVSYINLF